VDEPRSHYQISLTARQAVGLFVGLLLSLGLAFFFGLMAGLSGRRDAHAGPGPATTPAESQEAAVSEPMPAVETAVPMGAASRPTRRDVVAGAGIAGAEPTAPPTLQTFEDSTAEEAAAAPPPAATVRPAVAAKAAASTGRIWVQVASLSSRSEADAIGARLTKRGYHTQVIADGSKGRMRVRVGPYRTTEDARRAAEKLRKQEKIQNPWVVSEGK
jgi:cell division protein FtsN